MNDQMREIAKRRFKVELEALPEVEQRVVQNFNERRHVSRDTNQEFETKLTFGQRLADKVAAFGGSWTFIMIFGVILAFWVMLNSLLLARSGSAFDPFPYILLNLFLSMLAAIQAPIILMSQKRMAAKDRLDAAHDYEVNLKAELEILGVHEKLDELSEKKWADLIVIQQEQIRLLTLLVQHPGVAGKNGHTQEGTHGV
jgi:uncharacterized membrane protein